jgi:hypothetical protein
MRLLVLIAGLRFVLSLATHRGYGIFRDELYYLACAEHLDFGYVDHPPLIAFTTWLARAVLGDSLLAMRLLPALFGAATVVSAGLLCRTLGGGALAMSLAAVCTACSPLLLSFAHFNSMNVLEPLLWTMAAQLLVQLAQSPSPRRWLWLGLLCGVGLMNKHSMLFFGFAAALALVVHAPLRAQLRTPFPYVAFAIAVLLFSPNLVWQAQHDFPTLEFMANARAHKNLALPAHAFLLEQLLQQGPLAAPVWLSGLWYGLRAPRDQHVRPLALVYLTLLALMLLTHAKPYYLGGAYPMLFAAGGVALEGWHRHLAQAALGLALASGLATLPLAVPVLPVPRYERYAAALGIQPSAAERHELGRLPQFFADMHGWSQLARDVATAFHALPPAERATCGIYANNYGEAGAIDFFGPALGLPGAISGHNSYHLWGLRGTSGQCLIVIGGDPADHARAFHEVRAVGESRDALRMPYENVTLWLLRGPRAPIHTLFAAAKHYE